MSTAAARVARSSVYAAFQPGRTRVNAALVADILHVLGVDDDQVARYQQDILRIQLPAPVNPTPEIMPDPSLPTPGLQAAPESCILPGHAGVHTWGPAVTIIIIASCIGLDQIGGDIVTQLKLYGFLDMIGTAVAAFLFGPWYGAAVGLGYNLLSAITSTPASAIFGLVNALGGLLWGFGARSWGMTRSWWRLLLLNLLVGFSCTVLAAPINVLVYGGYAPGHALANVVSQLSAAGASIWMAVFSSNLVSSLVDKTISGFAGFAIVILLLRLQDRNQFEQRKVSL